MRSTKSVRWAMAFTGMLTLGGVMLGPIVSCSSADVASCADGSSPPCPPVGPQPGDQGWAPGVRLPSPGAAAPRGLFDVRGIIHAHSVYSHDACDGAPRSGDEQTGPINEPCLADFRAAVCATLTDYVMLTDHNTSFAFTEFPDTLLYDEGQGDELIEREGRAVANRLSCEGGRQVLVMAGTESGPMAVGLEGHVPGTPQERNDLYGSVTPEAMVAMKDAGALVLMQHTEDWTVEQLTELPVDGFEMFNLHRNLIIGAGGAIELVSDLSQQPEKIMHPDLILLNIVNEDETYLKTWAEVLSSGARRVTTMGTDCHQNTLQQILADGERIDSYRRMMSFFSNHLLVENASYNDADLKSALAAGRLYGAFEMFGHPSGFDFYASTNGQTFEMGDEVSAADDIRVHVSVPEVQDLDPVVEAPVINARLLRANGSKWEVVAESESTIDLPVDTAGAYRAEIRMQPRHLIPYLNGYGHLADRDFVWVYSNAIYVQP